MSDLLDFSQKTVIITGAGGGLGKCYALFFASRGANVVVNDMSRDAADNVVNQIKISGKGKAISNYDNVVDGHKIVQQAVDQFGTVHILINNAGVLRDKSFKSMTDQEWDVVQAVHVQGPYACTKAAWPIMRKQKYGRIINTASAAGLYGNFGQANYSAAKLSQVTFSKTLAREGAKYNIIINAIAPVAASQMTATIMPPEMLKELTPEAIVPLVAYLVSEQNTNESGQVYEAGAGWYGKLRRERSRGAVFKTDDSFTPSAVMARFDEINDFQKPEYPQHITDAKYLEFLERAKKLSSNKQSSPVEFRGKTVLVTGAGNGLGRAYALMFGKLGANVVVNDMSQEACDKVVKEVKQLGAQAVPNVCSVEDGMNVVKSALDSFGALHVVINNAGILRDKSFASMTDAEWDIVMRVHLRGTYSVSHAAWPIFLQQKYGRILNTTSAVGIYGNFGQANYSTAKAGILGLTQTLAIEGKKHNIFCNTIAPNAGTSMTATIWPAEMVQAFKPDYVAPLVGYLTSEANQDTTGKLYEVSGGWCAAVRWQRSFGYSFPAGQVTPEKLQQKWNQIIKFDERATYPTSTTEALEQIIANFGAENESNASSSAAFVEDYFDPEDSELVATAKKVIPAPLEYSFTERDCILYNLGIGATEKQLKYVYEAHEDFQVIPTFGVIPQFSSSSQMPIDQWLPNFSPMMLLHGEQYLAIKKLPIPTAGTFVNQSRLLEVTDKGKAAAVVSITHTYDKESGDLLFENQSTMFIRGSGGFGGKKSSGDRGPATAPNKPPNRKPDAVTQEKTSSKQAALYRLNGDYNPLHIDPAFSAIGGFEIPILHGLCFFGISGKHVYENFGPFKDIKVRFVGSIYPGETIETHMWKEGDKVIFVTKCKERDTVVLGSAAVTLA